MLLSRVECACYGQNDDHDHDPDPDNGLNVNFNKSLERFSAFAVYNWDGFCAVQVSMCNAPCCDN